MHTFSGALAVRHVLVPAAVLAALLGAYYAGGPALAALVAPAVNRELGLLEHLEAAVLAAAAVAAAHAAWTARAGSAVRRWGLVVAVAAAALLAEELDYGRHHVVLLLGDAAWPDAPPALHNRAVGDDHQVVDYLKKAANVGLALWFVLAALVWGGGRRPGGRLAAAVRRTGLRIPNPWYAATVGLYAAVSQAAHALQAAAERGGAGWRPLDGNVSEFGELVVYYLLALYAADVLRGAGRDAGAAAPGTTARTWPHAAGGVVRTLRAASWHGCGASHAAAGPADAPPADRRAA